MSRLHKIMLGIFCGGVLLCGIGAGVTFGEFSSLSYGGEKIIGETDMQEKEIDVAFEPGEEPWKIYNYAGYGRHGIFSGIETDEEVPENTLRLCVRYNADCLEPYVEMWEEGREISLGFNWYGRSDMELFMEVKDLVLADLKEGKLSSYEAVEVESVEIFVNPINEEDVLFY